MTTDIQALRDLQSQMATTGTLDEAATIALKAVLSLLSPTLPSDAVALRASLHLRPTGAYRGIVTLESNVELAGVHDVRPSLTAWQWLERTRRPLRIDVQNHRAYQLSGQPLPHGRQAVPFRSREHLLGRDTTQLIALPLLRSGQRLDGFIAVEVTGTEPPTISLQLEASLELVAVLTCAVVGDLPHATQAVDASDWGLPVVGTAMQPCLRALQLGAPTDQTLLLLGPTGVGKTQLARTCWNKSARADGPYETINMASSPDDLRHGLLFGWRKGAFTGAEKDTEGLVARTDGGTLFIDEIDKLPRGSQGRLLELLDDGYYRVLGDPVRRQADVRVIVGSNADLKEKVAEGTFLEDLYYRINGFPIRIPSLAERGDEVPTWTRHFLDRRLELIGRRCRYIEERAMLLLSEQDWPGNLRQFNNMIQRAALYAVAEQPEGELILMARHVEQALVQDGQPVKRDLIMALRAAAREFVDIASEEHSALSWTHAGCFTAFVLPEAIDRFGEREAFVKLGLAARLKASNHKKNIHREKEKMFAFLDVLRSEKESRHN